MAKCSECGYLGLRQLSDNDIVYADERVRQTGEIIGKDVQYARWPVCLLLKRDFRKERCHDDTARKIALNSEYPCDYDTEWIPWYGPKEHAEMLSQRLASEAKERSTEAISKIAEVQTDIAELTKQVAALQETHHQENRRDARSYSWISHIIALASLIVAILAVVSRFFAD